MARSGDGEGALAWVERWALRAVHRSTRARALVQRRWPRFRLRHSTWKLSPQWPAALAQRLLIADRSALTEWEKTATDESLG